MGILWYGTVSYSTEQSSTVQHCRVAYLTVYGVCVRVSVRIGRPAVLKRWASIVASTWCGDKGMCIGIGTGIGMGIGRAYVGQT